MLSGMWEEEYCIACEKIIPNSKPRPLFALGLCECYCVFSPWIGFRKADEQAKVMSYNYIYSLIVLTITIRPVVADMGHLERPWVSRD